MKNKYDSHKPDKHYHHEPGLPKNCLFIFCDKNSISRLISFFSVKPLDIKVNHLLIKRNSFAIHHSLTTLKCLYIEHTGLSLPYCQEDSPYMSGSRYI